MDCGPQLSVCGNRTSVTLRVQRMGFRLPSNSPWQLFPRLLSNSLAAPHPLSQRLLPAAIMEAPPPRAKRPLSTPRSQAAPQSRGGFSVCLRSSAWLLAQEKCVFSYHRRRPREILLEHEDGHRVGGATLGISRCEFYPMSTWEI